MKELIKNKTLYLMTIPGIVLLFLFNYLPMAGVIVAFKNFKYDLGIFKSEWTKPLFQNFEFFFTSDSFFRVTRNTLLLNIGFILAGTVFEVGFAIVLNEIRNKSFKKIAQASMLMPYFISWIVVSVFTFAVFNYDYGVANNLLKSLGVTPVDWYNEYSYWPAIMILINRWKFTGYGCIIYLAALSGIDEAYYEAAVIDGASKWKQIRHISIPLLMPMITTLTLLAVGRIMNADFGQFYAVIGENSVLYPSVDVIDTYVYRSLRKIGDVGMASAAGFYQSVISFILVLVCNQFARKYQSEGSIF